MKLPSGLSLYNIEPKNITVNAAPTKIISLPVKIQTTGKLPGMFRLISLEPIPDTVLLISPIEGNQLPKSISTESFDLSKVTRSTTSPAKLLIPKNFKLPPEENDEVEVEIKIKKGK